MRRGVAALLLLPGLAAAYPDGAPPAHTGTFGEPGCNACHFDAEPKPAGDRVRVVGLPAIASPGERYRLVLEIDGAVVAAGFQLAARTPDGGQAGVLASADASTEVIPSDGILYLGHTDADASRWAFWWQAPATGGSVHFYAMLNSANGDRSEFGDELLVFEALTRMEAERR